MALQLSQWIQDPTPQDPLPTQGTNTWIVRNLYHSNLGDYLNSNFENNEPHQHFVRNSTRLLLAYLNAQKANHTAWQTQLADYRNHVVGVVRPGKLPYARVSGASGVGKSTEVFAWLQTMQGGKVFIHKPVRDIQTASSIVWFVSMGSSPPAADGLHPNLKNQNMTEADVLDYLRDPDNLISIIVVDGACSSTFLYSIMERTLSLHAFLVICVSGQSTPSSNAMLCQFANGVFPGTSKIISSFVVNGFTLADYTAAQQIIDHDFIDNTEALRKERFYYAGGCARFYYGCETIADMKTMLKDKFRFVKDKTANFFAIGDYSSDAVNSLKTYVDGHCIIVSEFVSKEFAAEVDQAFITQASNALRNNPSWQGWVAELDMLQRVRSCAQEESRRTWEVRKIEGNRHVVAWRLNITDFIEYEDPGVDLVSYQPNFANIATNPNIVLFFAPTVWNNWGFDAVTVFFVKGKRRAGTASITPHVKVLQCTLAADHSKLLGEIAKFMAGLFPLNDNHTYSLATQTNFNQPRIEYSVMTWYNKYEAHNLNQGNITGLNQVRRWHPGFNIPANAAKYYFNHDCDYKEGENEFKP